VFAPWSAFTLEVFVLLVETVASERLRI
jgi:hypothetical protein